MKEKDITNLFHLSNQRVSYWIKKEITQIKRRSKLNRREINMIVKWAKERPIYYGEKYMQKISK